MESWIVESWTVIRGIIYSGMGIGDRKGEGVYMNCVTFLFFSSYRSFQRSLDEFSCEVVCFIDSGFFFEQFFLFFFLGGEFFFFSIDWEMYRSRFSAVYD